MTIYDYAKLSETEKENLLKGQALFMESFTEGKNTINVYFLDGFFVEVTVSKGKVIFNLPYQRAYKMEVSELAA